MTNTTVRPRRTIKQRARRLFLKALFLCAVMYILLAAVLFVMQDSLIFPRDAAGRSRFPQPENARSVWITAPNGDRIESWYLPGKGHEADSPGPAVLYFHGNAELIDGLPRRVQPYVDAGFGVMLVEYRGYGRSDGIPSQRAIVEDADCFREWLLEQAEVDSAQLVYHGRSLGGGVAAQLAARHEPSALVLESTFTSTASFASDLFMPGWLVRHPFRTDRVLRELECPVLLMHGTDDTLIPPAHSERLKSLSPNAQLVLLRGGHNDFPVNNDAYWGAIIPFVVENTR